MLRAFILFCQPLFLLLLATADADEHRPHELVRAIEQVESGGDPDAVGDGGKAVGILQIHPITARDANRIEGHDKYSLEDREDVSKSREIFWTITDHYSEGESYETIARRWNGGPDGDEQEATRKYWEKVKAELDKQ